MVALKNNGTGPVAEQLSSHVLLRYTPVSSGPVFLSKKGGLAADVSSGLIFLKNKQTNKQTKNQIIEISGIS